MKEAKQARAELQHALDALGDGSGHGVWGPGPVGEKLWDRAMANRRSGTPYAASAFDVTTTLAIKLARVGDDGLDRPRFISAMRLIAPVVLGVILGDEETPQ